MISSCIKKNDFFSKTACNKCREQAAIAAHVHISKVIFMRALTLSPIQAGYQEIPCYTCDNVSCCKPKRNSKTTTFLSELLKSWKVVELLPCWFLIIIGTIFWKCWNDPWCEVVISRLDTNHFHYFDHLELGVTGILEHRTENDLISVISYVVWYQSLWSGTDVTCNENNLIDIWWSLDCFYF